MAEADLDEKLNTRRATMMRDANEDLALLRDITDLGDFNKFATPALVYWINRAVKAEAREAELREALDIACERLSVAFCVLNYPKACPPDDDCPSDRDYACKPCWKRWAMEQALSERSNQ